jgi:iron(III) transport system permease protein
VTAAARPARRPSAGRLLLLAPALVVGALMLAPLGYLVVRAFQADLATVAALLLRPRTLALLVNTAALAAGVLALTTAIALPLAWLTTRTDLPFRRGVNILAILPLAVPGYVMAYALIGLSGNFGFMNQVFGWTLPRPQGWLGATVALSLYTYPYLYLNLRAAFSGLDQTLEESARSLGCSPAQVFARVTLPHLMPALMAGWLVVGLYTIGDFGAVALMRYEAFSYALYLAYSATFDRLYAAWIALILVAVALTVVWWESRLRADAHYARTGSGTGAHFRRVTLPPAARAAAWIFIAAVVIAALGLPVAVLGFWLGQAPLWPVMPDLVRAFGQSLSVAAPAAALAVLMALPVAMLAVRHPSPLSTLVNRLAFVGYAIPPLAFALAFVFLALHGLRFLYQTHVLLVLVYALAFLALALGPIRAALYQARPSLEDAARALGYGPIATFAYVVLPFIRRGVVAGFVLVFVIAMKELPMAFLLAPTGFRPLAIQLFSRTSEGMLTAAAPYAAAIVIFSGLTVGFVLRQEKRLD